MSKTTVIHHSADFDGIFCREIARKFLPDAELIGWDFGDKPLAVPEGKVYILDLPVDRPFGAQFTKVDEGLPLCVWTPKDTSTKAQEEAINNSIRFDEMLPNVIWIDHHRTSIESHPANIAGYRIDGVAACRLAWQWFSHSFNSGGTDKKRSEHWNMWMAPKKEDYVNRTVSEPLAVRLAGEYDIWDKRDPCAELFQHGLRSRNLDGWWEHMLGGKTADNITVGEIERLMESGVKVDLQPDGRANIRGIAEQIVENLLKRGEAIQYARAQEYAEVITQQGFDLQWEGLTFIACNSHELDIRSHLFEAGLKPHHKAMLGFTFSGTDWRVSLYGRPEFPDIDLSAIAKKYGGGGHKHACGFRSKALPWVVDRFLAWPLPLSVASDTCVTERGRELRSGTNLLDYDEAKLMFEWVFTR